jgi:hypothetical protein
LPSSRPGRSRTTSEIGVASSRGWVFRADTNPIGFALAIATKLFVIGLAIAEILHAFGLVGDPLLALKSLMPFN